MKSCLIPHSGSSSNSDMSVLVIWVGTIGTVCVSYSSYSSKIPLNIRWPLLSWKDEIKFPCFTVIYSYKASYPPMLPCNLLWGPWKTFMMTNILGIIFYCCSSEWNTSLSKAGINLLYHSDLLAYPLRSLNWNFLFIYVTLIWLLVFLLAKVQLCLNKCLICNFV